MATSQRFVIVLRLGVREQKELILDSQFCVWGRMQPHVVLVAVGSDGLVLHIFFGFGLIVINLILHVGS